MKNFTDIIIKPAVNEKSMGLADKNKYTFLVNIKANKIEIKEAIENAYKVKVGAVNTMINRGKIKRYKFASGKTPNWKKAIVTLKEGRIDVI